MIIKTNLEKAKVIGHNARRLDRNEKMKPLDVEVTIPGMAEQAEAKRKVIRDTNEKVQADIDNATSDVGIIEALAGLNAEESESVTLKAV